MSQTVMDPITYSESLQAAGMPKAQADIIARSQSAAFDSMLKAKELATRQDLQAGLDRLRLEMAAMKVDLIRWMIGLIAGLAAFLVAVLTWLRPV